MDSAFQWHLPCPKKWDNESKINFFLYMLDVWVENSPKIGTLLLESHDV